MGDALLEFDEDEASNDDDDDEAGWEPVVFEPEYARGFDITGSDMPQLSHLQRVLTAQFYDVLRRLGVIFGGKLVLPGPKRNFEAQARKVFQEIPRANEADDAFSIEMTNRNSPIGEIRADSLLQLTNVCLARCRNALAVSDEIIEVIIAFRREQARLGEVMRENRETIRRLKSEIRRFAKAIHYDPEARISDDGVKKIEPVLIEARNAVDDLELKLNSHRRRAVIIDMFLERLRPAIFDGNADLIVRREVVSRHTIMILNDSTTG